MNSVAPIWDGNETWLVLGGLGLLAAFPLAFAIILPALYFPILIMLIALIFRGIAFEFRFKAAPHRGTGGTPRSITARSWRRWHKGLCSAPSFRDFRCKAASLQAARSTGCGRSAS